MKISELNDSIERGIINQHVFRRFNDAYNYGTSSSMDWLISSLKSLLSIVKEGRVIFIILDESEQLRSSIKTSEELCNWISLNYPECTDLVAHPHG